MTQDLYLSIYVSIHIYIYRCKEKERKREINREIEKKKKKTNNFDKTIHEYEYLEHSQRKYKQTKLFT